jgi:hypothetical protein
MKKTGTLGSPGAKPGRPTCAHRTSGHYTLTPQQDILGTKRLIRDIERGVRYFWAQRPHVMRPEPDFIDAGLGRHYGS